MVHSAFSISFTYKRSGAFFSAASLAVVISEWAWDVCFDLSYRKFCFYFGSFYYTEEI